MKTNVLLISLVATMLTLLSCNGAGQPGNSTEGSTTSGTTSQQGGTTRSTTDKPTGPTEAPDLVSVSNFREGTTNAQGEPTTLVDFGFDQRAYLKGGDRTNFHLARKDGSDALDATSMTPEDDKEGDTLVKTPFSRQAQTWRLCPRLRGQPDGNLAQTGCEQR